MCTYQFADGGHAQVGVGDLVGLYKARVQLRREQRVRQTTKEALEQRRYHVDVLPALVLL